MENFKNFKNLKKLTKALQKVTSNKDEIPEEVLNLLFEWYWHKCIITDLNAFILRADENEIESIERFDEYWGEGGFEKLDNLMESDPGARPVRRNRQNNQNNEYWYTFEEIINDAKGWHLLEQEKIEKNLEREDLPESIESIIKTFGLYESFQKSPMFRDLFPKTLPAKKYKESKPRPRTFKGRY